MLELKTPGEVDAMAGAGAVVADLLRQVRTAATAGVRLAELDTLGRDVMRRAGAVSSFLGYQPYPELMPYPAVICTSVNDVALHGIPGRYALRDGDLLSVDCAAAVDGWTADAAVTFGVGTTDPADELLLAAAQRALADGIAAAVDGGRLGDVSAAIGAVGRGAGYGINTDFGGHGIGRTMHEEPSVPNDGRPGRGLRLRPGVVVAIEPWFFGGGSDDYRVDPDGWTLRSADGSNAVHVEHTVAVTADGPRVLTA